MNWVRLWNDMPTDPKWRVVAKRSGRSLPEVLAVFVHMMTNAGANATERGVLENWCHDDIAAALDMEPEHVEAIYDAMQGKTLEGAALTGWEKRQPKREDGSAERAKAWRERNRTQANAPKRPDTDTDTEKNSNTPLPPNGGMVGVQVNDHWSKEAANIQAKAAYEAGLQIKQGVATKSARAFQAAVGELDGSKGITLREGRLTVSPEIASDLAAEYPGIDVTSVCDKAAPEVLKQRYPRRDDALASLRKWARCALEDKARGRGATPQKAATFGPKVIPWDHKVKLVEGYDRTQAWPLSAGPRPGMPGSVITAEEVARARAEYSPRGASMTGGANGAH